MMLRSVKACVHFLSLHEPVVMCVCSFRRCSSVSLLVVAVVIRIVSVTVITLLMINYVQNRSLF